MTKRQAIGYIRTSAIDDPKIIDGFKKRIMSYCQQRDLRLAGFMIDERVAANVPFEDRPRGKAVCKAIANPALSDIVAIDMYSMFRNARDGLKLVEQFQGQQSTLHLIDVGGETINTATGVGRQFLSILRGMSELESKMMGERTAAGLKAIKSEIEKNGEYTTRKGKVINKLGNPNNEKGAPHIMRAARKRGADADGWTMEVAKPEILRSISELHAAGKAANWTSISDNLTDRKVPTRRKNGRWHAATVSRCVSRLKTLDAWDDAVMQKK